MTTPIWLLNQTILDSPGNIRGDLIKALADNNIEYKIIDDSDRLSPIKIEDDIQSRPVVTYGSIDFIDRLPALYPGAYGFNNNMRCSEWMVQYPADWLLNSDFFMLPAGILLNNAAPYYSILGDNLFIKPDHWKKSFTGFVLNRYTANELKSLVKLGHIHPTTTLCVVSSAKRISAEYRFVIVNKKVITGSEYSWDEDRTSFFDVPDGVRYFADEVANFDWQPDIVYTLDIADTPMGHRIIEINSFSSAGLYGCDRDIIVKEITNIAKIEFEGDL